MLQKILHTGAVAKPGPHSHKVLMARRASFQPQTDPKAPPRCCAAPGCALAGEFRAPKDRALREYLWFCLEHVRQYNSGWDFYRGMGPADIESAIRLDSVGQRPTWPLGSLGGVRLDSERMVDAMGILRETALHEKRRTPPRHEAPPELRAALGLLELEWPLDPATLKSRYKELAKRYHPDANGGDRSTEDKLKDINRAYSLLRQKIGRAEPAHAG